jgi:outer membrane lipoprotein-sorting protein
VNKLASGSVATIALLACCVVTSTPCQADPPNLDAVLKAHRASRGLIESTSCRVRFTITSLGAGDKSSTQSCSGQYWASANAVRAKIVEGDEALDYVWKDSVRQCLLTNSAGGTKAVAATRAGYASPHIHRCDAWLRGLLVISPPEDLSGLPLEQLASQSEGAPEVERKVVDGRPITALRLRFPPSKQPARAADWTIEVHLDPATNLLIRKVIYTASTKSGRFTRQEEVGQFKECAPGIYFPERVAGKSESGGKVTTTSETVFEDISINRPLPADTFVFRYPNGIHVTDSISNTSYRVDAAGNPTSKGVSLGTVPPVPSGLQESARGAETKEEPKPLTRWILPASGILVALGLALLVYRRARGRAA